LTLAEAGLMLAGIEAGSLLHEDVNASSCEVVTFWQSLVELLVVTRDGVRLLPVIRVVVCIGTMIVVVIEGVVVLGVVDAMVVVVVI
jgi:hypothetical protein